MLITKIDFAKLGHVLFDILFCLVFHGIGDLQKAHVIAIFELFEHDKERELQKKNNMENYYISEIYILKTNKNVINTFRAK